MRILTLIALPGLFGFAACVEADSPAAANSFVGSWDCGMTNIALTNTTYTLGTETLPIKAVSQDGRNYTLYFADGYLIGLGAVTETGMTWVSGSTGDQFNCRRVN